MVSHIIARLVILIFGTLYPAYASYKAIKTKNIKEYVKWMMYWVIFALFTCIETLADIIVSFWLPFYYELKIIFVLWLLSPATKGSSILYRKLVHPQLSKNEAEIDQYLLRAKEQGYTALVQLGSRGFSYATALMVQTALKGQATLVGHLRKSYSLNDLDDDSSSHPPPAYDAQRGIQDEAYKWHSEDALSTSGDKRATLRPRPTCEQSSLHRRTASKPSSTKSPKSYKKSSTIPLTSVPRSPRHSEVTGGYVTLPRTSRSSRTSTKRRSMSRPSSRLPDSEEELIS